MRPLLWMSSLCIWITFQKKKKVCACTWKHPKFSVWFALLVLHLYSIIGTALVKGHLNSDFVLIMFWCAPEKKVTICLVLPNLHLGSVFLTNIMRGDLIFCLVLPILHLDSNLLIWWASQSVLSCLYTWPTRSKTAISLPLPTCIYILNFKALVLFRSSILI